MYPIVVSFILFFINVGLYAEQDVPTVVIEPTENNTQPVDPFSTYKAEVVSPRKLREANRQSLSELVHDQVGVESQSYCSNCGAKRLTINGLKGEHTSILVDGLPLHSAVSSFYGVDSIPVNGIEQVVVMRGTGASLTNPEAIGGTLNLTTSNPLRSEQLYSTSFTANSSLNLSAMNHSLLASLPNKKNTFGVTLGAQFTQQNAWDEDENLVAESPERKNYAGMAKFRYLPSPKNDFTLRLGASHLSILGGPVQATKPSIVRPVPAQESDFEDGNVEKRFIGDPSKITDWISLNRYEGAFHWTHFLSQVTTFAWNTGYARQEQRSIYQHGFDYLHNDNLVVSDASVEWLLDEQHILKTGLFFKLQRLRSASDILFVQNGIPKDDFDNISFANYIKYSYLPSDSFELDAALRLDKTSINWLSLSNKVDEFVVAPRLQLRHNITDSLSQRFSYGLGYRTPLTFFESQHGNNENGYQIDIHSLEKAHSLVYSLSYNTPVAYITGGIHYTNLQNMAYGVETQGAPILYQNTSEKFDIWASDLLVGYQLTPEWFLEGSAEFFLYPDGYARKLPTAAIEQRFQIKSNLNLGDFGFNVAATIVGSRDLSRYGSYPNHFVDRNQLPAPETQGDERKDQRAPAYLVIDTSVDYDVSKELSLTFGVSNLFNETQVKHGDSPSTWHWHFDHAHYDGLHTWGVNRGREVYLKLAASF